jgi:lambda repressor-like predicted transcriptional regulator
MKTETEASPKSEGRIVRIKAEELPKRTPERLAELRWLSENVEPDLSDIPEQTYDDCIYRDAAGDFPGRSFLRDAVVAAMEKRGWTAYRLHKEAKLHRPTLSVSATNEFVKGQRNVGILYVEAMMKALGIGLDTSGVPASDGAESLKSSTDPADEPR